MRWLILLLVVVGLMFLGGWLYYQDTGDTSEIILDKEKVEQDTSEAVEMGKEAVEDAAEGVKKLGEEVEESFSATPPADDVAPEEGEREVVQ